MFEFEFESHGEYATFIRRFEKEIGTEYDCDRHDDGTYSVTVFDCTDAELRHVTGWGL